MPDFTEAERIYLTEMRALATDEQGREVLVGLSAEETDFYMAHTRRFSTGDRDRGGVETYLALNAKHEKARLEVLGSEIYLRNENPPRH